MGLVEGQGQFVWNTNDKDGTDMNVLKLHPRSVEKICPAILKCNRVLHTTSNAILSMNFQLCIGSSIASRGTAGVESIWG